MLPGDQFSPEDQKHDQLMQRFRDRLDRYRQRYYQDNPGIAPEVVPQDAPPPPQDSQPRRRTGRNQA
jgi:hypothetical protein